MKWRVSEILDMSVVDATAITTDKLGQSPHVSIRHMGSDKDDIIMVGSWMHFAIVELLKNAMRATVEATVTGLTSVSDKLPPVQVKWSAREGMLNVLVVDDGVGMSRRARQTAFELFSTSAAPTQITYTYSGNFGPPSHGHGVGLPLTQLYSKMLGGETCVISAPSVGTTVHWTCSI
jgi:signal transduction histidine kinase